MTDSKKLSNQYNNRIYKNSKELALFIHEYRCAVCGCVSLSNHVHHIDRNNQNNSLLNLAVVCAEHHKMIHANKITIKYNSSTFKYNMIRKFERFRSMYLNENQIL